MGMAAILVTDCDNFSNLLLFPHPKVAPYEIWTKLAQRLQRRSRLKLLTIFPFKCIELIQMDREANNLAVKRSNVNVLQFF